MFHKFTLSTFLLCLIGSSSASETLVLIAEHDQVIPRKNSERLIEGLIAISPKVHLLDDVDHNSISGHRNYYHLIKNFL